jgi:hypothetical protein
MIVCGIGARGAKRIGEMLEKNASLETLNLRCESPFTSHTSFHFDPMCLVADVHSGESHG